jgi:hypothetical protein
MFASLERAVELEPNHETYSLLQKAYVERGMEAEADMVNEKLKTLIVPSGKPRRILRPRKVVI